MSGTCQISSQSQSGMSDMRFTVKEYATKHGLSENTIYKRISRGTLPFEKVGKIVYILNDSERNFPDKSESGQSGMSDIPHSEEKKSTNHSTNNDLIDILNGQIDFLKNQLNAKDKQNEQLNSQIQIQAKQLSQALELQREAVEEKKQNNMLMAGFQKAMGLLENSRSNNEYVDIPQEKNNVNEKKTKKPKKKKKGKN